MTLQQRTAGVMVVISIFVAGANMLRSWSVDNWISIALSAVMLLLCSVCFFVESKALKWLQSSMAVAIGMASLMLSPTGYMSFGFLPMFAGFSLWYGYGFYNRWPKVMISVTAGCLFGSAFSFYSDPQRAAVLLFAIVSAFVIIVMAITHRSREEHKFAEKAMKANARAIHTINLMERELSHAKRNQ